MMTYFTVAGSRPSFFRPPTITSSDSCSKVVSIRMIPSELVSAQDERSLVPTKYTSSKTFAASVYELLRLGGGGAGVTSRDGAFRGGTHIASSKPRKSTPAGFLRGAGRRSIVSAT